MTTVLGAIALDSTVELVSEGVPAKFSELKINQIILSEERIKPNISPSSADTKVNSGGRFNDGGIDISTFSSGELQIVADFVELIKGKIKAIIEA